MSQKNNNKKQQQQAEATEPRARNPSQSTRRRQEKRMSNFNAEKTRNEGTDFLKRNDAWSAVMQADEHGHHIDMAALQRSVPPAPAKKETPPKDGKVFEMPDYHRLIPDNRHAYNNLDYCGFLELAYRSYNNLNALDSRLGRQITAGAYVHACIEMLWIRKFNVAEKNGILLDFDVSRLNAIVGAEHARIPGEIYEYLKTVGEYTDPLSQNWRMNLPAAAIPNTRRTVNNVNFLGGDFGIPDAVNHNAYECYISPLASRQTVSREYHEADVQPLPDLMPPDLVATENLLGWRPNARLAPAEAQNRLPERTWATDPIGSRIQHCPEIWNLVQDLLTQFEDRHDIKTGLPLDSIGRPAQMAFVETTVGDLPTILHRAPISVTSYSQLNASEIGTVVRFENRRSRTNEQPGLCFLTAAGAAPADWLGTVNANFDRQAPFAPVMGINNGLQNMRLFHLDTTEDHDVCVMDFIRLNFNKKK